MAAPYQQQYYAAPRGYYPYPANYAPYSPKQPYRAVRVNSRLLYPALLVLLGIAIAGFGLVRVEKVDGRLLRLPPSTEVAAVVFCEPCAGINGERVAPGKVVVVDRVDRLVALGNLDSVRQIQYLYPVGD